MESEEALNDSIKLYETQLEQVKLAISSSEEGSNRDDLVTLHSDIEELLRLTKESLDTLKTTSNSETNEKQDDPLADEYALFKAELADLDDQTEEKSANDGSQSSGPDDEGVDIQDELSELMGSKCQAPYTSKSGGTSYHNALVSSIEIADSVSDLEHIQVRVLFTNPTEDGMVPCPFFLDSKCTYGEKQCRYSHGHLVQLPQLREYKEPNFKLIKPGCWVLAKMTEHLWKPAVLEDVVSDEVCTLKYEGRFQAIPVSDLIPLSSGTQAGVCSDLSSDSEPEIEKPGYDLSAMVEKSLTREPASQKLGTWEKYTKGIGSKLMEKMGYVVGTGLGKDGGGRLDPIEALILPAGKSLDHCMNLREAAGGSKDLFSAERIQQKLALRKLRQSRRLYLREKRQEKHDVFNVINKLSSGAGSSGVKGRELKQKLAATSGRELNVERFKIAEDIRQTERNIYVLKDSLSRQKPGSIPHKKILAKLNSAQGHLSSLQNVDSRVAREQNFRESKKQLTTF